jgi:hypothetical protein
MTGIDSYHEFARQLPRANDLVVALIEEIGRQGQCGTLNPAVGYCLRQAGLSTVVVTGDLTCPGAPVEHMESGYHLWVLVSDGKQCWHVDLANHFLCASWYRDHLSPDRWYRVARGKEEGPPIPLAEDTFVWGRMADRGIKLQVETVTAHDPHFDVLDSIGKRDRVVQLFQEHGFADPYGYDAGVLDLATLHVPD